MQHNNSVQIGDVGNEELAGENVFDDDEHYLNEELLGSNARFGVQELTTSHHVGGLQFSTQDMRNPYYNPSTTSLSTRVGLQQPVSVTTSQTPH